MKIYSKLIGIIFGVLMGVGMITGYIMMSLTQEVVKQSVEEEALMTAKIISANLYSHIKEKKNNLDSIVLEHKNIRNASYHTFDALALFDERGMLYSSGTPDVNYSEVLKSGKTYAAKDGYVIVHSKINGTSAIGITKIKDWLDFQTDRYIVYILDTEGNIVWHPDAAKIGQKKKGNIVIEGKELAFEEFLKEGKNNVGVHTEEKMLEAFAYVPEVNLVVEFAMPLEIAYAGMNRIRDIFIIISIITLIFIILYTNVLIKGVLKPISVLSAAMKGFEKGEFKEVKISSSDEIGELTSSFNDMAEKTTTAMNRLREANQEMENFTYAISHDLKAPILSMQGFISLLFEECKDKMDETSRHYLNRIQFNVNTMESLVKDLLELSRIGKRTNMVEIFSYDIIQQALLTLEHEIKNKNIKVSIKDNFPVIRCNPDNIFQVFLNLLDNAIKYGATIIEIGWERRSDRLRFWVKDNGTGMEKSYLGIIWEMKSVKRNGTGLGLSIIKKAVKMHGGNVWVISEKGKGSEFGFSLPMKKE